MAVQRLGCGNVGCVQGEAGLAGLDPAAVGAHSLRSGFLTEAAKAQPDVAQHWQKLGWAVFQNPEERDDKKRLEEAKRCWSKAISVDTLDDLEYVRRLMASDPVFEQYRDGPVGG